MTEATTRRPKAANVPQGMIEQASVFLQDLPEKPKETLSLRQAVDQIRSQIQSAFAKGYSYEEVAQILSEKGINISASTLKNYVPSGRRQAAQAAKVQDEQSTAVKPRKRRTRQEQTETDDFIDSRAFSEQDDDDPDDDAVESTSDLSLNGPIPSVWASSDTLPEISEESEPAPRKRGRTSNAAKDGGQSKSPRRGRAAAAKPTTRSTNGRRKKTQVQE